MTAGEDLVPEVALERAISKAIDFLYRNQLPYGEFKMYASTDEQLDNEYYFDSNVFVTSLVLYSLGFRQDERIEEMVRRGLEFLLSEMEGPGLWRYWSSRNKKRDLLSPDLDDVCCISHILEQNGRSFPENRKYVLANRSPAGTFYTWMAPRAHGSSALRAEFNQVVMSEGLLRILLSDAINHVDCVVNANVLLYLGENEETQPAINFLVDIVLQGQEEGNSQSYPDRLAFHYKLSRAYFNGVSSLGKTIERIVNCVVSEQAENGSLGNELLTACAACTLLNCAQRPAALDKAIAYLLTTQREDGSWPRLRFYIGPAPHYGSEELTTALCTEALTRYRGGRRGVRLAFR